MRDEDLTDLKNLPLLAGIEEHSFAQLTRGAYVQTFPPAIEIIQESQRADFLHLLIDGAVELFSNWHTRETTMSILTPNATFVLAAVLSAKPFLMSARTLVRSRIALIPASDVNEVFKSDGIFAASVALELANDYRNTVRTLKNVKLRSSVERLANYLIRESNLRGEAAEFRIRHEKRLIASFLGMSPENLSRAFATLKMHGVACDGARIKIAQMEDLRRLAKPTQLLDGE